LQINYSKPASKFISTQDKRTKIRLKEAIEGLSDTPPMGDIKLMQKYSIDTYRLRVGKFRVMFRHVTLDDGQQVLSILDVGSRGDIYK
jgi:mRNA interferase RelE/StbE